MRSEAARIIGERIQSARQRAGGTRTELAAVSGVEISNLQRYETGRQLPSLATLVRIADALGIDPGLLVADLTTEDFPQARLRPQLLAEFVDRRRA